ncbi:MAG TPA: nitrate- and nitrite sensing domain-containing protein, partial [Streptomyces sp.]
MRPPRTTPATSAPASARPVPPARGRRAHAGPPADERTERAADRHPEQDERSAPRSRRSLRPRTVRAKIISLLMVPVVSLLALWGFATVTTAQDVARMRQAQRVDNTVRSPVASAVTALQAERTAALTRLLAPDKHSAAALEQRSGHTDSALDRLWLGRNHTVADAGHVPREAADRLRTFFDSARELRALRTDLLKPPRGRLTERRTGGGADQDAVYARYTRTITDAFAVTGALTGIQDARSGSEARVLLELGQAGEMLAREDALLGSARLTGALDGERLRRFTGTVATRRSLAETAGADLPAAGRSTWQSLTGQ